MAILVYAENTAGKFKKTVYEVITYAKAVADSLNTTVTALSIGEVDESELRTLGNYGASNVWYVSADRLTRFVNQAYASIITQAAEQTGAPVIVLSNTFSGRGLAPRVAAKLGAGLADGAVDFPTVTGDTLTVKKTAFSGQAFVYTELVSPTKVIALTPNTIDLRETEGRAAIAAFQPALDERDFTATINDIVRAVDNVPLPEAEIVVSAGRGLKGPENWGMVEELARILGAATACSKPVSDAGWRPHAEHVGQTGITISPNLYIAIGISGAIQHIAGVSASKTIVVINKDPDAPFFKVADYGIVGDAFEIVPKLTAAIRSYKGQE